MIDMHNIPASILAAALLTSVITASTASAQTAPVALVISNSKYSALPSLPMCDLSANLVTAVLSRAGFKVTRKNDLNNARLGTAIAAVGDDAAATPDSRSVIYICTYALPYADRLFLLPAEARIERESDVLTGGIVARLLMSSVAGPGSQAGLVLMDVATPPGKNAPDFTSMLRPSDAAHGGLIAAKLSSTDPLGPAPLASALAESIGDGKIEIGSLLRTLSANPALRRSILTVRPPTEPSWLLGAPALEAAAPVPATGPEPIAAPTQAPPPAAPVSTPAPTPASNAESGLADPNPAERRRLQLVLSRLGYYRGRVDGVFATDTALAIRQFQRDSNAEPTGKLTTRQMEQLLQ